VAAARCCWCVTFHPSPPLAVRACHHSTLHRGQLKWSLARRAAPQQQQQTQMLPAAAHLAAAAAVVQQLAVMTEVAARVQLRWHLACRQHHLLVLLLVE
jgi:hypothetical protein